jgi:DNA-binding NtrC family response regulator
LREEVRLLRRLVIGPEPDLRSMAEAVGADQAVSALRRRLLRMEPALIVGARGTGRIRLVLGVHSLQGRRAPLLPVLCAADPDALVVDGRSRQPDDSPFERAQGGTLVLSGIDELSDASIEQLESWLTATGGGREVDVWVVGTIRPDVATTAEQTRARYERLHSLLGTPIVLPTIRERLDVLPLLIEMLVAEVCRPEQRSLPRVPERFVDECRHYHWPGNVAELRRVVLRAVELARRGVLSLAPIPQSHPQAVVPYRDAAEVFDRRILSHALQASRGNIPEAARLLGLPESTFRYKARKLELKLKYPESD